MGFKKKNSVPNCCSLLECTSSVNIISFAFGDVFLVICQSIPILIVNHISKCNTIEADLEQYTQRSKTIAT